MDEIYDWLMRSPDSKPPELDELLFQLGLISEGGDESSAALSIWAEQTTDKNLVVTDGQVQCAHAHAHVP